MNDLVMTSTGTVAAPVFDHALYHEANLVADGRLVHALPSKLMLYTSLFNLAGHAGWTMERVAIVEQTTLELRKLVYETRRLKLLEQMRSYSHEC